jgi:Zn-dependent metalloprotease
MLQALANRGIEAQRAAALQTLAADQTIRAVRASQVPVAPAGARGISLLGAGGQKHRTIYSADSTQTLPGTVVRTEGAPPTGDPAVDEAYDGLGATYDLYWEAYERNSIDDAGMPLNGTVHMEKNTTTRSGMDSEWSLAMAMVNCSIDSRSPLMSSAMN